MTKLLLKIFVKNYKDTENAVARKRVGTLSSVLGIILNTLLAAAKITVGALFGIISVLADGMNNLTDCGSNVVALVGFKLSAKPADKEHPYGHRRVEYVAGMIVAFLILVLAFELGAESAGKIADLIKGEASAKDFSVVTVVILGVSILVKFWMFIFNRKLGKMYKSELLSATSADSISDVCATSAVLISVLVAHFTDFDPDGIMGVIVALVIAVQGIKILKEMFSRLIGEAPDKELINGIEARIKNFDGVLGIHDLNVHSYGPNSFYASVHVEVDASASVMDSHDMIDRIERDFSENTNVVLVIHMDPVVVNDPELDEYRKEVKQIVKSIDGEFDIHDFRMVKGPTHINLIFDVSITFDTKLTPQKIAETIQTEIAKLHENVYVVPTVEHRIS